MNLSRVSHGFWQRSRSPRVAIAAFVFSSGVTGGVEMLIARGLADSFSARWLIPALAAAVLWAGFSVTAMIVCWPYLVRQSLLRAAAIGGLAGVLAMMQVTATILDASVTNSLKIPMVRAGVAGFLAAPAICMVMAVLDAVASRPMSRSDTLPVRVEGRLLQSTLVYYWLCVLSSPLVARWFLDWGYLPGFFPVMVLMVPAAGGFALAAHFLDGSMSQLGRRSGPVVGVFGVAVTVVVVVLARDLLEGTSGLGTAISSVTLGGASAAAAIYFVLGLTRIRV